MMFKVEMMDWIFQKNDVFFLKNIYSCKNARH